MIEFARSTGDDGIEVVLEFDPEQATYHVTAKKDGQELKDSFKASWPNPLFGPDAVDVAEANARVEVLCQKLLLPS